MDPTAVPATPPKESIVPQSPQIQDSLNAIKSKAEEFREFIEVEVLKIIKDLAEKGQTDDAKIKEIAKLALDSVKPGMELDELYKASVKLDDRNPELAPLVFKIMKQYEEIYAKNATDQVANYVRQGQYDNAQDLVKKILQFKIAS
jgi:hypothetical protein